MSNTKTKQERQPGDSITLFTPRGALRYPKLVEPDHGTEAYPKNPPEYNTGLILTRGAPGVDAFLAKLDEMMEESRELAEAKLADLPLKTRKKIEAEGGVKADDPYEVVYDDQTEEETGDVILKAKTKASGVSRKTGKPWSRQVDLFDAKGKPIPNRLRKTIRIWGGTVARVNLDLRAYFVEGSGRYGLGRYLNAAQIIELVDSGARQASSYGFSDEGDGFDTDDAGFDTDGGADDNAFDGGTAEDTSADF